PAPPAPPAAAPRKSLQGLADPGPRLPDLLLGAAQPQPADGAEGHDLEQAYVRALLRLVGGDRRVAGGLNLQRVQRLPREQHLAVSHPINHGRLVAVDASDDLARQHLRREAITLRRA